MSDETYDNKRFSIDPDIRIDTLNDRIIGHSKKITALIDLVRSIEDDNKKYHQALLDMGWTPPEKS